MESQNVKNTKFGMYKNIYKRSARFNFKFDH